MSKKIMMVLVLLSGLGLFAAPALAGGWVVITLENLPAEFRAGEDVELAFWVRQHGVTPTHGVSPIIIGRNSESGEQIRVLVTKGNKVGLFEATLNFPTAGEWNWSISASPFPQNFEQATLRVLEPKPAVAGESTSTQFSEMVPNAMRAGGVGLIAAAILVLIIYSLRKRDAAVSISGD